MKNIKIKNLPFQIPAGKIICVGRNYAEHAKELGHEIPEKPVLFLKPSSSLIQSEKDVIHPSFSNEMHHEVELVLLIGKTIKDADKKLAEDVIAGYAVGLDMTLRDLQNELKKKGNPWTVSKCFDTSAVISEVILKKDYTLTLDEEISLSVNGTVRQKEKLNKMIFKPVEIVEYISSMMTIEEGDLIFTGTPAGVGKVNRGDTINAEIENVGKLHCNVI